MGVAEGFAEDGDGAGEFFFGFVEAACFYEDIGEAGAHVGGAPGFGFAGFLFAGEGGAEDFFCFGPALLIGHEEGEVGAGRGDG